MPHPANGTSAQVQTPAHLAPNSLIKAAIVVVLGAVLLTLSAKIKVPFYPVSMTMQPLVILGLALMFGSRLAIATVLLYLAQGAMGYPVFTDTPERGVGLAYMSGPTGGFLVGFVFAAAVTGWLADRGWTRHLGLSLLAALIGLIVLYLPGVAWLTQIIALKAGYLVGFEKALQLGVMPFALKDLVAAALAACAATAALAAFKRS